MNRLSLRDACLLTVLVVVLVVVPRAAADTNDDRWCSYNQIRPHPRGLCSSTLSNTVAAVCRNMRQNNRGKRADFSLDALTKGQKAGGLILGKREAIGFLQKRSRYQNIVCECCYNHCTLGELQEYCY